MTQRSKQFDFVVVANRLPVDRITDDDGKPGWKRSPGGLVAGLEPVMRMQDGAWVGWGGSTNEKIAPFDMDDMRLVPVELSDSEFEQYYEGFANASLWPLYHDVIAPPEFHRAWWDAYLRVNKRFAEAAAKVASDKAVVWVHDYQLQLVPAMLRELRPDVKIGFFNHIPFPPYEIFAQLPWRRRILEGLLGADLIGFQRPYDAANFLRAVRRKIGTTARHGMVKVPATDGGEGRIAKAQAFPISIDSEALSELAADPDVQRRAAEIRTELGDPKVLMLGVDRMDYTKGIRHRIKAFGELLDDGVLKVPDVTLVQIATPSRERLEYYKQIRTDVELAVGRINGEHGELGAAAVHYMHHSYPRREMVAFYLAADVMLVTALRDGMNLVAKEYVATRLDNTGALVLSEFTGAADELRQAILVNPHDITDLKDSIMRAVNIEPKEAARRMRSLRRRVSEDDVKHWSHRFLTTLAHVRDHS